MTDFDNRPEVSGNSNNPDSEALEDGFINGLSVRVDGVGFAPVTARADALKEGVLFNVSEMAAAVGFSYPVAVRKHLWQDIQDAPAMARPGKANTVSERLHHVLRFAQAAVQLAPPEARAVHYRMSLPTAQEPEDVGYTIKLLCELGDAGEPVMSLSNPNKDVDLALGELALTPGALDALVTAHRSPLAYLARHARGDWGEVDADDWAANDRNALTGSGRVRSAYTLPTGDQLWVITEWNRSVTTLLLPQEY